MFALKNDDLKNGGKNSRAGIERTKRSRTASGKNNMHGKYAASNRGQMDPEIQLEILKRKVQSDPYAVGMQLEDEEDFYEISYHKWIFALLLAFVVLIAGAKLADKEQLQEPTSVGSSVTVSPNYVKITLPALTEDVLLCSGSAKQEYDGQLTLKSAVQTGSPYRPFYFEYTLMNADGTLYLGEKENLSDARAYTLKESVQHIAIHNLKVDTTYYYKVEAGGQTKSGSFHTAPSTRFVNIPGLVNTRDIGGGKTLDGKTVKQGLLIRGVELDGLVNVSFFVPNEELENVQADFGFVYDMDLRGSSVFSGKYVSRLGVPHRFYSAPMYGEIFSPDYQQSIKRIFTDLADSKKYPMYLHCTWGMDRTGTIVFLLQGVLNMSEEDMKREYFLTGYHNPSLVETNNMDVIISGLSAYAGNTLQEKIVTFLTEEIGITHEQLDSIRSIFLEG